MVWNVRRRVRQSNRRRKLIGRVQELKIDHWLMPAIVGGIAGGIAAFFRVRALNAKVRAHPCPECGQVLGNQRPGKSTATGTGERVEAGMAKHESSIPP